MKILCTHPGRVVAVTADTVTVKLRDTEDMVRFMHTHPTVKVGDDVTAGSVVGTSLSESEGQA